MKKFLRRLGKGVIALLVLVAAFYLEENWRGKHAWEKYRHEREAKGDSFELSSIVPPPVPDADNFAATPLFAELFPKSPEHPRLEAVKLPDCPTAAGNWRMGRVENLAAWQACFSNANLLAALSKYDPILNEIAEASHRPKCRFLISCDDYANAQLPHLTYPRSLARAYRLRALVELAAGENDAALSDVQTCLRLADTLECAPVLLSFLVRVAVLEIPIQPVWEGIASHRWTDAQLATLQAEFERVDQFKAYANALHGERMFICASMLRLNAKPDDFVDNSLPPAVRKLIGRIVPTPAWLYQNQLTIDRFYTTTYLPAIDSEHRHISPGAIKKIDESIHAARVTLGNVLCLMLEPAVTSSAKGVARSQTAIDETAVACALERYRLAKGELPEKLDALVPAYLAKVPHDVIDGQPLRYRRTAVDQFVLYSVGWNETDDGGQIALTNDKPPHPDFDKGDWVWSSTRR